MVSRPSSAVFPRNLAFTLVLCLFGAAAVFLLHSANAETASAQSQQCVSLADPRDIPAPRILTFDDLKAGALINDQYVPTYGVSFPGGRNVPTIFEPPAGEAASNPDVLRNEPPVGATSSGIPLEMDFSFPRKYVGMYLGDGLLPG